MDEAQREKIKEIAEEMCKTFTKEYLLAYKTALIEDIKEEFNSEPKPQKLLVREDEPKEPLYEGTLFVGTKVLWMKKWKERYLVVEPNYVIKFWVNKKAHDENKKVKGIINLQNYKIAKESEWFKGDKDLAIKVEHSKRAAKYFCCADKESYENWRKIIKTCCGKAQASLSEDPVLRKAFIEAYRKLRWAIHYWGCYSIEGTEGEALGALISERIEEIVLRPIYEPLTGAKLSFTRKACQKATNSVVGVAVAGAWQGVQTAVAPLKDKIREALKSLMTPLMEKEKEIKEKIHDGVMDKVNPVLEEIVAPNLSKLLKCLDGPMTDAYCDLLKVFGEHGPKLATPDDFKEFVRSTRYYWRSNMWPVVDKLDPIEEPLWALHVIFDNISWWRTYYGIIDGMIQTMQNAIYTLETKVLGDGGAAAFPGVVKDFDHDLKLLLKDEICGIILNIIQPTFSSKVVEPCQAVIQPLADLIPDTLKDFLDVSVSLEDVLNGILESSIETVVVGALAKRNDEIDQTAAKIAP